MEYKEKAVYTADFSVLIFNNNDFIVYLTR